MAKSHSPAVPVEFVFNPNWWHQHYDISFEEDFYFDHDARIENDLLMRRALAERFGLCSPDPQPRPVIGSTYVAGGFVLPALFGAQVKFAPGEAPWPVAMDLSRDEVMALEVPDIHTTWPMDVLLADMDRLETEFGHVVGDFDTDGVLNTALCVRGQRLFIDFLEDPDLVSHLCGVIAETQVKVAQAVKARTGSCAISTNRSIVNVDRGTYLHSNCSVQMVSPATYAEFLLPHEQYLSAHLQPYGIHHCGNNAHLFAGHYAQAPISFLDTGWGSDVALCRAALPDTFLNLRLNPVRMLRETTETIRQDVLQLLGAAGGRERVGVCCINMDYGTPDENVLAVLETVASYR